MRARWIGGIFAISAVALATAVSLAQRPERPRPTVLSVPTEPDADRKVWRSKADSQSLVTPSHATEPSTAEPGQAPEDPMVAVGAFLRRNRNEADDSIRALTLEAEALRARLAKVEAALARWQAVAGSLNPGPKWTQPEPASEPGPDLSPTELPTGPAVEAKSKGDPPPTSSDPPASPPPTLPPTLPGDLPEPR